MITLVKKYVSSGINSGAFPDRYNSANGQMATFLVRTVVGGHFALVRLVCVLFSVCLKLYGTDLLGHGLCFSLLFLTLSRGVRTAATVLMEAMERVMDV